MAYGLRYVLPFQSTKRIDYRIEIELAGYTGTPTELTGTPSAITVTVNDDDFIYTPLRLSTATIEVVGGNELQKLFATGWQQYRVTLIRVVRNGSETSELVLWCGFVRPEEYTQDYANERFSLDIEAQSAVSVLEQIKYEHQYADGLKFVTVKSLIEVSLSAAQARWGYIYIPHTWAIDAEHYGENALLRPDCLISEQNFYDEENTPMTYQEILEQICRFAHCTLCDWRGDIWFVDWDYTDKYDCYTLADGKLVLVQADAVGADTMSVQAMGYHGASHTLDLLGGYNKARVRASNYSCNDKIFPDEDFDRLSVLVIDDTEVKFTFENGKTGGFLGIGASTKYGTNICRNRVLYVKPEKWEPHTYMPTGRQESGLPMPPTDDLYHYRNGYVRVYEQVEEVDITGVYMGSLANGFGDGKTSIGGQFMGRYGILAADNVRYGAVMARYCEWSLNEDGSDSISSYTYENVIFFRKVRVFEGTRNSDGIHYDRVTFKPDNYAGLFNYKGHLPVAAYCDGAISINFDVVLLGVGFKPKNGYAYNGYYYSGETAYCLDLNDYTGSDDRELLHRFYGIDTAVFTIMLRIGDHYYNGESWQTGETTFTIESEEFGKMGTFVRLKSTKTLSMPYNNADGYIIEIPELLTGELYFSIRDVNVNCAIKNLKLSFTPRDDMAIVTDGESDGGDRIYSNIVNEKFVNELDTIEEKISSYNRDGLCFGKILLNGDYIRGNLFEGITRRYVRPELMLLRRIVNQYEVAKTKLSQVLMYTPDLLPCDTITDSASDGKRFIQTGGEFRFADDEAEIKMMEIAE